MAFAFGTESFEYLRVEAHASIPGLRSETWSTRRAHHAGELLRGQIDIPQGLKSGFNLRLFGKTEVVPCYKTMPRRNSGRSLPQSRMEL
jgi:hypothetical protein